MLLNHRRQRGAAWLANLVPSSLFAESMEQASFCRSEEMSRSFNHQLIDVSSRPRARLMLVLPIESDYRASARICQAPAAAELTWSLPLHEHL